MRRRRHDVGVLERRRDHPRGDQTGNVRHVREQIRVGLVGDLAHALVVVQTRVCGRAGDEQLGAVRARERFAPVVIDQAGGLVQAVRHRLEKNGHRGDLLRVRLEPVAEVAAVG